MTFDVLPEALSESAIGMTATTATDSSGVEYFFTNTTFPDGSHDSGWQSSPTYRDTALDPETEYTYTVKARDLSANLNETAESAAESATTLPASNVDNLLLNPGFELDEDLDDPSDWTVVGGDVVKANGPNALQGTAPFAGLNMFQIQGNPWPRSARR